MQRNTKVVRPMCERLVTLDGTTNCKGELIMPWHIRENWRRFARPIMISSAGAGGKPLLPSGKVLLAS